MRWNGATRPACFGSSPKAVGNSYIFFFSYSTFRIRPHQEIHQLKPITLFWSKICSRIIINPLRKFRSFPRSFFIFSLRTSGIQILEHSKIYRNSRRFKLKLVDQNRTLVHINFINSLQENVAIYFYTSTKGSRFLTIKNGVNYISDFDVLVQLRRIHIHCRLNKYIKVHIKIFAKWQIRKKWKKALNALNHFVVYRDKLQETGLTSSEHEKLHWKLSS